MSATRRVVFCTFPSIYSSIVLKQLVLSDSIEVVAIIDSTRILNKKNNVISGSFQQIKLSGFRYATYLFMVTSLFGFLELIPLKNKLNKICSINKIADINKIPVIKTHDINSAEVIDNIKKYKPNFLLASHFNQLIKSEILDMPSLQCLNIHPSILPTYQGVDPVFYSLLDQKKEIGVTLHKMSEEFDSGENINQEKISVKKTDSLYSLNLQLFSAGAKLATEYISGSKLESFENDKALESNYDSWPSRKHIKNFKKKGLNLITIKQYLSFLSKGL